VDLPPWMGPWREERVLSAQPIHDDGPIIDMPEFTPAALRLAVERLSPVSIPAFHRSLETAATQASTRGTLAPLRALCPRWALFVALRRWPARAARLHELEKIVADQGTDSATREAAHLEIGEIAAAARREFEE